MKITKRISKSLRRMNSSPPVWSPETKSLKSMDESNATAPPAAQSSKDVERGRAERVRMAATRESDWLKDPAANHSDLDTTTLNDTSASSTLDASYKETNRRVGCRENFGNGGSEKWELARAAWKQRKDTTGKGREPTWSKKEVRKAVLLEAYTRSYDFAKPARLKDVARSCNALWEAEAEPEEPDDPLLRLYIPFVGGFSIAGH